MTAAAPRFIVVVTGLSGAGRSTALRVLEDLSFHCVDNLPTPLLGEAVALWSKQTGDVRVALGMDVRVGDYLDAAAAAVRELRAGGARVHVLFLDASDDALVRRYSESRRPHPLAYLSPAEGLHAHIQRERERLGGLRAMADRVIDTTRLTVHDLRRELISHFSSEVGTSLQMATRVVSFGFKYGVPVDADNVFDARFLPNPHFVPELRPRTGLDPEVSSFVLASAEGAEYLDALCALLNPLLPRYAREGKVTLTIAVGCTGGRHRSVAIAEALGRRLRDAGAPGEVRVSHRDADRGGVRTMDAQGTFEVLNELGLHARPATRIVQTASKFRSEVTLSRDGQTANAKSVMGVLLLLCPRGAKVEVRAEGDDAAEAVAAIGALFASRFGEGR